MASVRGSKMDIGVFERRKRASFDGDGYDEISLNYKKNVHGVCNSKRNERTNHNWRGLPEAATLIGFNIKLFSPRFTNSCNFKLLPFLVTLMVRSMLFFFSLNFMKPLDSPRSEENKLLACFECLSASKTISANRCDAISKYMQNPKQRSFVNFFASRFCSIENLLTAIQTMKKC